MIRAGGFRVLWLSDAGFIAEKKLLERKVPLECDILVRHQHNADFSGLTELLLAAKPQLILSSNDVYRLEEVLPQRLRDFCAEHQIPLFDLEVDGSVGMQFQANEAQVKSHLSGRSLTLKAKRSPADTSTE